MLVSAFALQVLSLIWEQLVRFDTLLQALTLVFVASDPKGHSHHKGAWGW